MTEWSWQARRAELEELGDSLEQSDRGRALLRDTVSRLISELECVQAGRTDEDIRQMHKRLEHVESRIDGLAQQVSVLERRIHEDVE